MRMHPRFALAAICGVISCGQALAQATVDPRALAPLQPAPAAQGSPPAKPATPTPERKPAPAKPPAKTPPAKPPAKPVPPAVPAAPPVLPSVPPPIAVPVRPVQPPAPVPVVPTAQGAATPIPGGQRITFGATGSDLNPATEAAIRATVHAAPPGPNTTFTVNAYAAGTPEDPSTARRLSLSRALAVRGVLIAEGIPSVRIYVKALGTTTPAFAEGPSERVDILVAAPPEATPPANPPMPPPSVPMPSPTPKPPGPAKR